MKVSHHPVGLESLDALAEVDSMCLFIAEDERPLQGLNGYLDWRLCGRLSRLLESGFFTGQLGDSVLLPSGGRIPAERVFALGVGKRKDLSPPIVADVLARAVQILGKAKVSGVALEVPNVASLDDAARNAAVEQVFLSRFPGERVTLLVDRSTDRRPPR